MSILHAYKTGIGPQYWILPGIRIRSTHYTVFSPGIDPQSVDSLPPYI